MQKKKDLFEQFIRQIPITADLYPIIRLIFPESDSTRGAYGLKEHSIGRIFADLLILPPHEKERLMNWKDPNLQAKHNCTVGDFPSVLLSVIEPRMSTNPSVKLTIGDVNKWLTDLYTSVDTDVRKDLFRDLIYRAKPLEVKWIIKIILKDMKIGVGIESILRHLHPNAVQLYHISNSIQHVLSTISHSPTDAPSEPAPTTIYFQPIKPMLSERVNPGDIPERFSHVRGDVFLEPKIDGERMLVHVDKRRGAVCILSRNGVNFTKKYGDRQLSPLILVAFKGLGAVFDGEMVAWDAQRGRIHPFGSNRHVGEAAGAAADSQPPDNDDEVGVSADGNMFYIIFDLIFYVDIDGNEHDLRNTALEDRRELLERILLPMEHRIEIIKSKRVPAGVDAVKEFLRQALDRREEGIVVKRANSVYKLNIRGMGWYKVKADYDNTFSDTLDLVVLGGYYSESSTGSEAHPLDAVTSFLVGVPKTTESPDGSKKTEFKTVTKVGTGLTQTQFVYLRNQLKNAVIPISPTGLPDWFGDWKPSKPNRPDVLFSPWLSASSVVLEVRAGEITSTNDFSSGYQLRFPRIVKPRTDKDWTDATTFDDLRQIATTDTDKDRVFIQDLSRFERGVGYVPKSPKEPKRRKLETVILGADALNGAVDEGRRGGGILEGVEVFVVNGSECAEIAKRLGATVAHMYRRDVTQYVIAERDDMKAKNIADFEHVPILNQTWLGDCETEGRLVEVNDSHVLRPAGDREEGNLF